MVDGDGEGTGQGPGDDPTAPPAPPLPPARPPQAQGQPPSVQPGAVQPGAVQPGARPPQGAGQSHRTSVLRHPTITVEPASQQAAPGATTELALAIVNNSDTVSDFTVQLDDRSVGWIRIEPATKNLWPGSRDVFRILVTPPRSAEVRAGLKQYGLTITSSGIPGGTANVSIQVDVLPFEEIEPRLVPRTSAGYFRGRHRVEIRNLGSAPWTARVTASDPEEALRITVPQQVTVGPGNTAVVSVTVRAKAWNIIGSTQGHPFSVDLDTGDGARQHLEANHNQRAVIPGRLVVPLLAAVALVVVGGLWALGVIPPGGGATATPSPAQPTATVVPTDSTPPIESPSASPPIESPSATTPPSEEPSPSASAEPSQPADVDDWAWERYITLLNQGNPFDVGAPFRGTADTDDGRARVQWFELAVMYRMNDTEQVFVVRPPVLSGFLNPPGSTEAPITGYPIDARKGDSNGRIFQRFEATVIVCRDDTSCFVIANPVHDLWRDHIDQLGYPTAGGVFVDPNTYFLFDGGRIVVDGAGNLVACDSNGGYIDGPITDCSPFMAGP